MFYSHEILTSRQYGVATVWLVATIGSKSSTRRVTRKAIQEVDVQRACGKILEPGAPIALRLQGNLLYGISRVHNEQCTYLAADAKKIRDQMQFFFRAFPGNQLELGAGLTKRENNLVEDDPAFDPDMPLPQFDIETLLINSTNTQKTSSQMSPQSSQFSGQSPEQGFAIQLDIDRSSSSGYQGYQFGLEGLSSAQKPDDKLLILPQDDDIFGTRGDWGLDIDENGNIIESAEPMVLDEEPQLPPLPPNRGEYDAPIDVGRLDEQPIFDDQDNVITQEGPLPEAEPFPERQRHMAWQNDERPSRQAPTRRKRLQNDESTQVSRTVLRDWQKRYLEYCGAHRTGLASATQAKRNAMLLTFGFGIGDIGRGTGLPGFVHPLAMEFSGDVLFTAVTGMTIAKPRTRGRRRKAAETVEDSEQAGDRRVRPKIMGNEKEQEQARATQEDQFVNLDDPVAGGAPLEVGRKVDHPMSDHLSSTLLPWNRGSSAVPGSSVRAPNQAQRGRDLSSPLNKRGDPQDIVRYSDDAPVGDFGSDGNFGGGFGSFDTSLDEMQRLDREPGAEEPTVEGTQAQKNMLFSQLDSEGHRFLNFVQDAADRDGEHRQDADFGIGRRWLAFDDMFVPQATPRSTAAQAFYHTLCLVTKGRMYVEQDGSGQEPFGAIWIGVEGGDDGPLT